MHWKSAVGARASPSPHHTLFERMTARFIPQPIPALVIAFHRACFGNIICVVLFSKGKLLTFLVTIRFYWAVMWAKCGGIKPKCISVQQRDLKQMRILPRKYKR